MCSMRNAVPFLVCNLDAFDLTVGLCFVLFVFEHVMFSIWRLAEHISKQCAVLEMRMPSIVM